MCSVEFCRASRGAAMALVLLAWATGCADVRNARIAPLAENSLFAVQGAGVSLKLESSEEILYGELLAATRDSLYLLTSDCPEAGCVARAIGVSQIQKAFVTRYRPNLSGTRTWAAFGAATTPSHGVFLVFSLPMWGLASYVVQKSAVNEAQVKFTAEDYRLAEVLPWARFPQGVPDGLRMHRFERPAWCENLPHEPEKNLEE